MYLDFLRTQQLLTFCTDICIEKIKRYKYIIALILINFLTHYLFISRYTFVSDDWGELVYCDFCHFPLTHLMLESQRPIYYIIFKVASDTFGNFAFAYQILNFITTSLIILLVFLIAKSLFKDVFQNPVVHAFLVAILISVAFNIDELFPWSIIFANNISYVLYLSSLYFYIKIKKNKYYLFLSLLSFFIAVFIYELGIFLPLISLLYDLFFQRNWKKSLFYIVPLGIYGSIRVTNWFGFGWIYINRNTLLYSAQFFQQFINNILHNFVREIGLTGLNMFYGVSGLLNLNYAISVFLIVLDIIFILMIYRYLVIHNLYKEQCAYNFKNAIKICCFGILGFVLSHLVISLSGFAETRHLIFMDFFIFLSIMALIGPNLTKKSVSMPLFCIILACVVICQGLSVNWIIAGDICASANQSIYENSKNLSYYNYVFVNATDLFSSKPNTALKSTLINGQYNPYLNSRALSEWAVISMLSGAGINTSVVRLIYGNAIDWNRAKVLVFENGSIMYDDTTTKTHNSINRTQYFELNSTNLFAHYYDKERSDFLFFNKLISGNKDTREI